MVSKAMGSRKIISGQVSHGRIFPGKARGAITLSCTIITYNEEARIARAIESVLELADEVVVLDSFSTDQTEKICKRYQKVIFKKHKFDGHVQQKNRAIELAKGTWILSIDADEVVTSELAKSIREFISDDNPGPAARIPRLTFHLGKWIRHGGWYNARYRLFQKGKAEWGGENPHDQVLLKENKDWKRNFGPRLKGDLLHYSFPDFSDQINTINKFSSIIAFTRHGQGRQFSVLRMLYKPFEKFIESYFAKRGFLDGIPGLIIAFSSAFSFFLREAKLYELQHTEVDRPTNLRSSYQVQSSKSKSKSKS